MIDAELDNRDGIVSSPNRTCNSAGTGVFMIVIKMMPSKIA